MSSVSSTTLAATPSSQAPPTELKLALAQNLASATVSSSQHVINQIDKATDVFQVLIKNMENELAVEQKKRALLEAEVITLKSQNNQLNQAMQAERDANTARFQTFQNQFNALSSQINAQQAQISNTITCATNHYNAYAKHRHGVPNPAWPTLYSSGPQ